MDNTMDINLRGDQFNASLSFFWKAFFSDGSVLEQFNENGIENKFQLIKDKFDKLVRFSLVNKDCSQCFTVDLENRFIIYNNYNIKDINLIENAKKENCRLIYFRRVKIEIGEVDLKEKSRIINYHLGFQYNTQDNQNRKIILQINDNGDFIITGE